MGYLSIGIGLLVLAQVMLCPVRAELFTALVHMEGLLGLEQELLGSLNTYIAAEKERYGKNCAIIIIKKKVIYRLQELEEFSDRVLQAHNLYSGKPAATHLYDPVNAFQLVNRYANTWMKLQDNVYTDNSKGYTVAYIHVMYRPQY